jgi:hypothetical protein
MGQNIGTSTLGDDGPSIKANNHGTCTGIISTPSHDTLHLSDLENYNRIDIF